MLAQPDRPSARDACGSSLPITRSKFEARKLESLLPCQRASAKSCHQRGTRGESCRIMSIGVQLEREASRAGRSADCCAISVKRAALDPDDVDKSLRIPLPHLEAIEEGRFDQLPGAAYIPAFLRAYASACRARRREGADRLPPLRRRADQARRSPAGGLPCRWTAARPIGLAVLTVLLVVAAGYAAWHYLPREQTVVAREGAAGARPPAGLAAGRADRATPAPTAGPATARGHRRPRLRCRPTRRRIDAARRPAARGLAGAIAAVPPPRRRPMPPGRAPGAAGRHRRCPSAAAAARTARPSARRRRAAAGPAETPPATPCRGAVADRRRPRPTRPPSPAAASLPVRVDTPVSVRTNSWIELRGPNGDVLAQTYVRAGESYVVPAALPTGSSTRADVVCLRRLRDTLRLAG